ncbi:MAG: insulinase family protein [Spirochaetes bacterium]|jgi:predicted Zn-dependent peptidase|nr:insulinase family protein [Spirochaetota bacterium]
MVIKYRQDNGLLVLLEPIAGVVSLSAGLWLKTGSRDERENEHGFAHFVEHMLFKGTAARSARELARMVDRVGGQHNAATNREYTCYYIDVVSEHAELAVDVLSDMYYNSLFDQSDFEKEKNVISEEIRMYEDTPDEYIHDLFMECMLSGHSLGHTILGSENGIKAASRSDLLSFFNENYRNDNAIFVVTGRFEEKDIRILIDRYFSTSRGGGPAVRIEPGTPGRIFRKHVERDLEQVHFCIGADGIKRNDDDRWALYTMSTILGGNMSSRLFQNIREKEGISYSIYSFHSSFSDLGIFGIYCATSPDTYLKAFELIMKECRDIFRDGITGEELDDAKTYMKGNLALSMESVEVRMGQLAKNEISYGRHFEFSEMVSQIDALGRDDLMRICDRIFGGSRLSLISVGGVKEPIKDSDLKL